MSFLSQPPEQPLVDWFFVGLVAASVEERGKLDVGQLVRQHFTLQRSFGVGFSTNTGTVSAATR